MRERCDVRNVVARHFTARRIDVVSRHHDFNRTAQLPGGDYRLDGSGVKTALTCFGDDENGHGSEP
jgi:hypothetical protein